MAITRRKGSNSFFLFGIQEEYDDLINNYTAAPSKGDKGYLHRRRFPFTRLTLDATGEQTQSESIVGGRADSLNTLDRLSAAGDFEGEMLPEDIPYLSELIMAPKEKPTSVAVSDLTLQSSDASNPGHVSGTGASTKYPDPDYPSKVEITGLTSGDVIQIKGFRRTGRKSNRQEAVTEYITASGTSATSKKFYTKFQTDGIKIGDRPDATRVFEPDGTKPRPTAAEVKYMPETYKTEMELGVDQSPGASVQMSKGGIPVTAYNVIANQAEYRIGTGGVRILLNLLASTVLNERMLTDETKQILKYNIDPEGGPQPNDVAISAGAVAGQDGSEEGDVFLYSGTKWVKEGSLSDISDDIPETIAAVSVISTAPAASTANNVYILSQNVSSGNGDNTTPANASKGSVWLDTNGSATPAHQGNLTGIDGITTLGTITLIADNAALASDNVNDNAVLESKSGYTGFPLSNLNYYPRWGGALYYHHATDKPKSNSDGKGTAFVDYNSAKTLAPTPFSDLIIRINQNYEEDDAITGDRETGQPIDSDRGVIEITFEADIYVEASDTLADNYARWQQYFRDNSTAELDFFLFNFLDDGRQYLIHVTCPVAQLTEIPALSVEGRQQMKRRLVWKCIPTAEASAEEPDTIKMTFWTKEQPYIAA